MLNRLRTEERGFGLVELVMAVTILNVSLLALVAAFNSASIVTKRASQVSTATVLADRQMELYRSLKYSKIGLETGLVTTANADTRYYANWPLGAPVNDLTCTDPTKPECQPIQTITGPDGRTYRIDSYIVATDFSDATMRDVKLIRVFVRDAADLDRVLVRQDSTFDESLGL